MARWLSVPSFFRRIPRRWLWGIASVGLVASTGLIALGMLRGPQRRASSHARRPAFQDSVMETTRTGPGSPIPHVEAAEVRSSELQTTDSNDASRSDHESVDLVSFHSESVDASRPNAHEPQTASWSRFRGPNGTGVSSEDSVATEWSDQKNIVWKTKLPGAGSSSPILTDRFLFVTSYTGYGSERGGSMDGLQRQLSCIERSNGKILWTKTKKAVLPDDPYQGMGVPEHGYATNTPVTDGEHVFVFFGKSGVIAYDLDGNEQWQTGVGTESGNRGWGTAASLILYKDLVIVNASEESQSIRALRKDTGELVWTAAASTLELAYGTPVIAKVNDDRDDLILAVPGEVWGLNPDTGKLVWYAETSLTGNLSPSVVLDGDIVYVFGGYRSSGSTAIRIGGKGDVTKSHVVWTSRNSSYVSTPVLCDGALYWIDDRGTFYSSSSKTGELLHRARVPGIESRDRPVYASPIAINNKLYFQTRHDGLIVAAANPNLEVLHQNRFDSDTSMCNATPAVGNGQLFLRSDTHLYCIAPSSH